MNAGAAGGAGKVGWVGHGHLPGLARAAGKGGMRDALLTTAFKVFLG